MSRSRLPRSPRSRIELRPTPHPIHIPQRIDVLCHIPFAKANRWIRNEMLCLIVANPVLHWEPLGSHAIERRMRDPQCPFLTVGIVWVQGADNDGVGRVVKEAILALSGHVAVLFRPRLVLLDGE